MTVDRSRLPALGPEPTFFFPDIRRRVLANGLRVCTVEHRDVPVLNTLLLLPAGAADDPADRPGLAAITGDLLDEGTGSAERTGVPRGTRPSRRDHRHGGGLRRHAARHHDAGAVCGARPGSARRSGDAPPPGRTRVRARPRAAPQSAEAAARCAVSRRRARVRAAPLRRASLWAPVDRHRGLTRRAHRRRCDSVSRHEIRSRLRHAHRRRRRDARPSGRSGGQSVRAVGSQRRTAGGQNDPIWLLLFPRTDSCWFTDRARPSRSCASGTCP